MTSISDDSPDSTFLSGDTISKVNDLSLRRGYNPNYFSVDNILAQQMLIECQTQMRIPKFGFLVPDCNSEDLPVGTKVELPLWAARPLCKPNRQFVRVTIPPKFQNAHRDIIEDKAWDVDIKKAHRYFFEAGHMCTSLFHSDAGKLAEMLPEILRQRLLNMGNYIVPERRHAWQQPAKLIPPNVMDLVEGQIFFDSLTGTNRVLNYADLLWYDNPETETDDAVNHGDAGSHGSQPQQTNQPMMGMNGGGGMYSHPQMMPSGYGTAGIGMSIPAVVQNMDSSASVPINQTQGQGHYHPQHHRQMM